MTQAEIDRLFRLERQATRLKHTGWACRLHERAVIAVREARFKLWLSERTIK